MLSVVTNKYHNTNTDFQKGHFSSNVSEPKCPFFLKLISVIFVFKIIRNEVHIMKKIKKAIVNILLLSVCFYSFINNNHYTKFENDIQPFENVFPNDDI